MKLEDLLFGEVDNGCANCGQRGRANLTKHHLDGNRNNREYDNQIVLCHNCHHRLTNKKGITDTDVKGLKRLLIKKTLTPWGINALKIASRNRFVVGIPFLLNHLVDLGYMKQGKVLIEHAEEVLADLGWLEESGKPGCNKDQYVVVQALFLITDKGRKLCEKWLAR
jgi:hypothetical protein